jgi:hypothetical protein
MNVTLDTAKAIYRRAIDEKARDSEGLDWWAAVTAEVAAVIHADSLAAAAKVIDWWHHDWSQVGDSAKAAAKRIRHAARVLNVY